MDQHPCDPIIIMHYNKQKQHIRVFLKWKFALNSLLKAYFAAHNLSGTMLTSAGPIVLLLLFTLLRERQRA